MADNGKNKQVTIYDLAKELNISASTVSRALKNHPGISKKTKELVHNLAKQKGYRLNTLASSLRTNHSNIIGVLVTDINRPFISSLISGIETGANKFGYHVLIAQSHDKKELESQNISNFYSSRVSGMIVSLAMESSSYEHFDMFFNQNIPVVFVDRIPHLDHVEKVEINNFKAGFEATEHLIQQGCKKIAHFGGAVSQKIYEERYHGYLAALKRYNYPLDENIIILDSILSRAEGERMAKEVLSLPEPPDGIFCANDRAAVSVIRYAKSKNVRIPDELAVVGFNNDPICEVIEPCLTSINHPSIIMGKFAAAKVINLIDPEVNIGADEYNIDTNLIIRNSSARIKKVKDC